MRIALIADTFPPFRTSGAVQLRDLSREFARQGHDLTVILPSAGLKEAWAVEDFEGVRILRLRSPKTKDVGYLRRTCAELLMPFAMRRNFRKSSLGSHRFEGVVWYSPSIFHGPFAMALKRLSGCKGYLVVRDIFPEWAVDMGLMGRGLPYRLFDVVARYQYSAADIIGVQTPGNLTYFDRWRGKPGRNLEVLPNWLGEAGTKRCPIRISQTRLAGRSIFVYAGNMGVAQSVDIIIDLAERLAQRTDVGFLLVGRGSEVKRLRGMVDERRLSNVLFFDEIDPDEVPDLYAQCHVGIVSLDLRHRSHNIPGKFLTYMQSGLGVLARVNPGNDLIDLIRQEGVGEACDNDRIDDLVEKAENLLMRLEDEVDIKKRCRRLFEAHFAVEQTVKQMVKALGVVSMS